MQGTVSTTQFTPLEAMEILGVDMSWVVEATGLNYNAVRRAIMGGRKKIHQETANLIANALALGLHEVAWPNDLTHLGRPPLTGGHANYRRPDEWRLGKVCEEHFILLSVSGECGYCDVTQEVAMRA